MPAVGIVSCLRRKSMTSCVVWEGCPTRRWRDEHLPVSQICTCGGVGVVMQGRKIPATHAAAADRQPNPELGRASAWSGKLCFGLPFDSSTAQHALPRDTNWATDTPERPLTDSVIEHVSFALSAVRGARATGVAERAQTAELAPGIPAHLEIIRHDPRVGEGQRWHGWKEQ